MIVAPGSVYSTYDVYNYYRRAGQRVLGEQNVFGFDYHVLLEYHRLARETLSETHGIPFGSEIMDIIRASRELLLDIYLERPDAILFIDGSKFPVDLYVEIARMRRELHRTFAIACYITESPYIDDVVDKYAKYCDVIFSNEKNDITRRDPSGERFVYYLPHSYDMLVHYPDDRQPTIDVFFCGTLFPERAKMLLQVDWTGINAQFYGSTSLLDDDTKQRLLDAGLLHDRLLTNSDVADLYRESKIVLNLDRTFGWTPDLEIIDTSDKYPYSVGPRVIEATACGALVVSQHRQEIPDTFGETVPIFNSAQELEQIIRYYLLHDSERQKLAKDANAIVLDGFSYDDRVEYVSSILKTSIQAVKQQRRIPNG